MKRGEKIIVTRTKSGLYKIEQEGKLTLVGEAASTAIVLMSAVFKTEASGDE